MKICPKCNTQHDDSVMFCGVCGCDLKNVQPVAPQPQPQVQAQPQPQVQPQVQPQPQPSYTTAAADPYDHTAEFSEQEKDEGKIFAMLPYLLSFIGVIIALLAGQNNRYIMFHVRQAMKFQVVAALIGIATVLLVWTIIVPIAGGICSIILLVLQIIAFFQVCNGQAKEPAILCKFKFLGK